MSVEHNDGQALRSAAQPRSSICPTVLARSGVPRLALGSPGDDRIISTVVEVISHWVDVGDGLERAVSAPRLHVPSRGRDLMLEVRPEDPDHLLTLERLGYSVHLPLSSLFSEYLNPAFGGVHAVAREHGRWRAVADPRRDGAALDSQEPSAT